MGRDTRKPRVSERLDSNQNIRNRPPPPTSSSTALDNDDKGSNFTKYRNSRITDNKKLLPAEENNNLPSDNEEDENGRDRDADKASTASGDSGSFSEPELPLEELSRLSIKTEGTLTARAPMVESDNRTHRYDPYVRTVSYTHVSGGGILAVEPCERPWISDPQLQMCVSNLRNGDLPELSAIEVAHELGEDPDAAQCTLIQNCEQVPTTVQEFGQSHGSPPSYSECSPLSLEGTSSPFQNYEHDSLLSSNYNTDSASTHSFENKKLVENINRGVTPDRGYESECDEPDSPQSIKSYSSNFAIHHSYTSPQHQSSLISPDSPQSVNSYNSNFAIHHSYTSPQHQSSLVPPDSPQSINSYSSNFAVHHSYTSPQHQSSSILPDSPQSINSFNSNFAIHHSYTSPQHQSSLISPVTRSITDNTSQSSSSYLSPLHTITNYPEIRSWPDIPEFNLVSGRDRIVKLMNTEKKAKAWALVNSKAKEEQLLTPDEDGDTELMKIMANGVPSFMEVAYALVEWLHRASGSPQLLAASNKQGHTALYMACKNRTEKDEAVVVRYLAETLIELNCFIPEQMFENGNTLLHIMAKAGDKTRYIMAELLSLRNQTTGEQIFDVNRVNNEGYTPLHVASYWHDAEKNPCFAVMKLLQQQGGNISIMEAKAGNTVLHLIASQSCDPALFRILLENSNEALKAINQKNYNEDTPLHLVAANNSIPLSRQKESYRLLLQNGAQKNLHNKSGKPPLALVTPERKTEIKSMMNPKRTFC